MNGHPLVGGLINVRAITEDGKLIGRSFGIINAQQIGKTISFLPAYLGALLNVQKKNMTVDYLSKSNNKRALFAYVQSRKVLPTPLTLELCILMPQEMTASLEEIAKGLERHFRTDLSTIRNMQVSMHEFTELSVSELTETVLCLPITAPGLDGITNSMLKVLLQESPNVLLDIVNNSLKNSWIPQE